MITVTDKWPGTAIIPTAVTGCESFKLLDAGGTEYTLAQITADPTIVITQIKCYNVFVPAGGRTTLTITGKITQVLDELINVVGEGSAGEARAKSYGVSIAKDVYKYDAATSTLSANKLTAQDEIVADDVVCYVMTVKNLKNAGITAVELVDKLPAGLAPESVTYQGAAGSVLLYRGNTYTNLGATGDASNVQTTTAFDLASGETVRIYLFAKVSQGAIDTSENNGKKIVNAAYVRFGAVETGDATANIYTMFDNTQKVSLSKTVELVADYNDDLTYAGTKMTTYDGKNYTPNVDENRSGMVVWDGAYVVYRVEIKNCNVPRVGIYELIDTLPDGMAFVGVSKYGGRGYYNSGLDANNDPKSGTQPPNLSDKLYFDGESGPWISGSLKYGDGTLIGVTYDAAARQVHILFNGGDESNPLLLVPGLANGGALNNDEKPFIYIVARVTDANSTSSFVNKAELRVNMSVHKPASVTTNTETTDGAYNYIAATATNRTLNMVPGITKETVGHYTAPGPLIAGTDNISPGETLRFTVKIKNEDNSRGTGVNAKDANAGNLRDFTVVDYLPPEYTYKAGSASIGLNAMYQKGGDVQTTAALSAVTQEPTITVLDDGRTKLTWSFMGKDMRLFNRYYSGATEGYMHVLTYDADWNAAYPKVYGNYTNTADVIHSYDFRSVSTGSPDTAVKSIAASTVVNVYGAAGTAAEKKVTNAGGTTVSGQDAANTVPITAGETVRYTLRVQNAATTNTTYAKDLVIIDELPRAVGDTGVVNRVGRDSAFAVLFGAAPGVSVSLKNALGVETVVGAGNYTVRYGMSAGGLNTNGDWSQAETGGRIAWGTASDGKNAIRVAFADGYHIQKGDTIILSFDAVASRDAKPGETAWNSFGYAYRAVTGTETTAKIYAEPQRVGIRVPDATLTVTKTVTGDPAPTNAEFTFVLKQNGAALAGVRYTLGASTETTLADGSFKLKAGQTATFHVDPGSGFTVEEALTGLPANFRFVNATPATSGDGSASAEVFSYKTVAAGGTAGAVFTNSYDTPPTIDLHVEKQWLGAFDPNRPTSVSVQLLGNGAPEGLPVTLNVGNSWQHTWNNLDNLTTTWTVAETSVLSTGYTSQVTGSNLDGFVIANTYAPASVVTTEAQVEKVVAGDPNPPSETFRFRLSAVSYTAPAGSADTMRPNQMPMPVGSVNGTKTVGITGAGRAGFGVFTFNKAGTYAYTIRENRGANALYTYDDSVYTLTYAVSDAGGSLSYTLTITKPGAAPTAVIFTNTYTTPSTIDLNVEKQWAGAFDPNRPTSVSVQLLGNGIPEGSPVTLNAGNAWRHTWTNLNNLNTTWTVAETGVLPAGYTSQITGNSIDGFVLTNTYAPTAVVAAEAQVEKVVAGNPNPPSDTFRFRLSALSYTAPAGSADTMRAEQMPMPVGSANGAKTVEVTGAGRVGFGTFTFRKAGTYVYTIREDDGANALYTYDHSVYTLTYTVTDAGGSLSYTLTITKPGATPAAMVFTNIYRPVGQLTVSKTVLGGGNANTLFTFRFTFSEAGRYAYTVSGGATGTIATGESLQLKHGESVTVTLPQGVTYTVVEDAYASYVPSPADRTFAGTISAAPSRADYTNRFDPPYIPPIITITGDLIVQKTVTGDLGDRKQDFAFTIAFDAAGSYAYTGSKSGMIASGDTIQLKHGESITIVNLPAGTRYTVTESGNAGYRTYATNATGVISANGTVAAAFTNTRSDVPRTGDDNTLMLGLLLMVISAAGMALMGIGVYNLRRKKHKS